MTDDTGVVQLVPNTIPKADVSRLLDVPMDRLLSLLLDVCDNIVPGKGTNEDLGLATTLSAANEGGGCHPPGSTKGPYDRRPSLRVFGG